VNQSTHGHTPPIKIKIEIIAFPGLIVEIVEHDCPFLELFQLFENSTFVKKKRQLSIK
jgi:hypothetical protein